MLKEFKEFLEKFNVIPAAVGLVLALAIKPVVDAVVDLIMQLVGLAVGNNDPGSFVANLKIGGEVVGQRELESGKIVEDVEGGLLVGPFLQELISFIVVAFVVFMIVKALNKGGAKTTAAATPDQALLTEIRDLLKSGR